MRATLPPGPEANVSPPSPWNPAASGLVISCAYAPCIVQAGPYFPVEPNG